jgi:hypothetical protein
VFAERNCFTAGRRKKRRRTTCSWLEKRVDRGPNNEIGDGDRERRGVDWSEGRREKRSGRRMEH